MNDRDGEEKCKAAANRLHKIQKELPGRSRPTPARVRVKRLSNASFETKHHPLAAFPGLLSFTQARRIKVIWREKSRQLSFFFLLFPRFGRELRSVLGEKLILVACFLDGQRNLRALQT